MLKLNARNVRSSLSFVKTCFIAQKKVAIITCMKDVMMRKKRAYRTMKGSKISGKGWLSTLI